LPQPIDQLDRFGTMVIARALNQCDSAGQYPPITRKDCVNHILANIHLIDLTPFPENKQA
jgi:hypothetical protein